MIWAAVVIIVFQACVIGLLLWFVHTFGAYAVAVVKAHESNTVIYQQAIKILEYTHHVLQEDIERQSA